MAACHYGAAHAFVHRRSLAGDDRSSQAVLYRRTLLNLDLTHNLMLNRTFNRFLPLRGLRGIGRFDSDWLILEGHARPLSGKHRLSFLCRLTYAERKLLFACRPVGKSVIRLIIREA
jgi:hypothetical protein